VSFLRPATPNLFYPLPFSDLQASGEVMRRLVARVPLYRAKVRKKKREAEQQGTGKEKQKRKRGGGHDSHSDDYDVCDFSGD
jgi:hypothetical protein